MKIICPYCFEAVEDHEVEFRSEIFTDDDNCPVDGFEIDNYVYGQNDELDKWMFFRKYDEGEDDLKYEDFWEKFGGTTESNPADDLLGVKSYKRKVINPNNKAHQAYLKQQEDGSYFIRDKQSGMVTQIALKSIAINGKIYPETLCASRVCPHCHNPFPQNYGRFPVKFTTVIGITGAGKTVYISKLLENMANYAPKVGLTASVTAPSARNFVLHNPVRHTDPLPPATPADSFQQPVFYDILKDEGNNRVRRETFVLYDVAGEIFNNADAIENFAKYIKHSDGMILLVDPMSIADIANNVEQSDKYQQRASVNTVLSAIYGLVKHNQYNKCVVPLAVCLPKCDLPALQSAFDPELVELLINDVKGIRQPGSIKCTAQFNADDYNNIADYLHKFLMDHEFAMLTNVDTEYSNYAYFAFTVLGCGTDADNKPVSHVSPKRIEEPLFWLFNQFGYIGTSHPIARAIPLPKHCPKSRCGSSNTSIITDPAEKTRVVRKLFTKIIEPVDYICNDCGYKWDSAVEKSELDDNE